MQNFNKMCWMHGKKKISALDYRTESEQVLCACYVGSYTQCHQNKESQYMAFCETEVYVAYARYLHTSYKL